MQNKVLAICVNYKNDMDTIEYIHNLLSQNVSFRLEALVIDNNETNESNVSLENLQTLYSNVFVYKAEKNLGYFNAASWGLRKYLMNNPMPDWIIISNTDIYPKDDNTIDTLIHLHKDKPPAILAPNIISLRTNLKQNPYMKDRPSKWKMNMYVLIYRYNCTTHIYEFMHVIKTLIKRKWNYKNTNYLEPIPIYAPHGSMIVFSKEYFEKGGTIDYGAFLFCEEIFVAETARSLGLEIIYEPRVDVFHREHATTKMSNRMRQLKYESVKYCLIKFFKDS